MTRAEWQKDFGLRAQAARQLAGLTRPQVARAMGRSTPWLTLLEEGERMCAAYEAVALALMLDFPLPLVDQPQKPKGVPCKTE
jgi:transcriptional regulator with XRE-family HTH domain